MTDLDLGADVRQLLDEVRAAMADSDATTVDIIGLALRELLGSYRVMRSLIDSELRDERREPADKIRAIEGLGMTRQYAAELTPLQAEQDHREAVKAELAELAKELRTLAKRLNPYSRDRLSDAEYEAELTRLRAGASPEAALEVVQFELRHLNEREELPDEAEDADRDRLRAERARLRARENERYADQDRLRPRSRRTTGAHHEQVSTQPALPRGAGPGERPGRPQGSVRGRPPRRAPQGLPLGQRAAGAPPARPGDLTWPPRHRRRT